MAWTKISRWAWWLRSFPGFLLICLIVLPVVRAAAQRPSNPVAVPRGLFRERVRVINMIPILQSGESGQDSEPNLAVNAENPDQTVGSAFTLDPNGATDRAPIFVSSDGGYTWAMNAIVPSANGATGDISVGYASKGGELYTGILLDDGRLDMRILRTANPFGAAMMQQMVQRDLADQPWAEARTTTVNGTDADHAYVTFNNYGARSSNGGTGRTASIEFSPSARTALAPSGFNLVTLEARNAFQQDMPAVRVSIHPDGTAYAAFYRWRQNNTPLPHCDVIVVRDASWGSGTNPFTNLTDPGDNVSGRIVAQDVVVPAFTAALGANRLVASNLSIAVDPRNSANVWLAWADRVGTTDYTLHVRRSTDRAQTWSADLLTVTNATNPALAVNSNGVVGFLYQALIGTVGNGRWETHIDRTGDGTTWSDMILSNTPDNNPARIFHPYIGDYVDLVSVGTGFRGIFSASNIPDNANFPQGVTYQRNANFATHTLFRTDGTTRVRASIDPFFFRIDSPLIVDICQPSSLLCDKIVLNPGELMFKCTKLPCRVVDPIPRNCTVKFSCPGCPAGGLCPPWYHLFFDELDPKVWDVSVFTRNGDPVQHTIRKTKQGIVLSFRPSKRLFRDRAIGDYVLGFESSKVRIGTTVRFPVRLEMSEFPYDEHLKRNQ